MNAPELLQALESHFSEKKGRNPAYSLRALSRDLGVSHVSLITTLKNRKCSAGLALKISDHLKLDDHKVLVVLRSILQ